MYKPRDVAPEAAWRDIAEWLRASGAPHAVYAPRALCRTGYGWVEHVEHRSCGEPADYAWKRSATSSSPWPVIRSVGPRSQRSRGGRRPPLLDAAPDGRFRLDSDMPDPFPHFGLFRGLPGIGFVLLRLAGAHDLPPPLLME